MDKYLISGSVALLALQVFILLADLNMLPKDWGFNDVSSSSSHQIIGKINSKYNNVRKKLSHSVYWESGQENDNLHAYDSVLTLKNSTAQISLDNDVKINLHENTMVVIEPTEKEQNSNLVLMQFSKGRLQANTGKKTIKFANKSWTIEASEGTELSLRSVDADNVEVELNSGGIQLANTDTNEVKKIQGQQRVELKKGSLETKKIVEDVVWSNELKNVIYSHSPEISYMLEWEGRAERLIQINPDNSTETVDLRPGQNLFLKQLAPGHYIFRLERGTTSSNSLELDVLEAPLITYLSPLPRDRTNASTEVVFSWSPVENIHHYILETSDNREFANSETKKIKYGSRTEMEFNNEAHTYWRIQAVDRQGYTIPPLYFNELYIVDDPLQAPQLIQPKLRQPASPEKPKKKDPKTSSRWKEWIQNVAHWIVPSAHAEEMEVKLKPAPKKKEPLRKIILSWSEIPGADHYIIEIADDPLFMNPTVNKKTEATEFEWIGFGKKKYYWRVAAGKGNKLGLFSEVSEFDVSLLKPISDKELIPSQPPVRLVTVTPKEEPAAEPLPEKPKPEPLVKRDPRPSKWTVAVLSTAQWISETNEEDDFDADFGGFTPIQLEFAGRFDWSETHDLKFGLTYENRTWEAEDSDELPFQEELNEHLFSFYLDYIKLDKSNYWGFYLESDSFHGRLEPQEIESIAKIGVGGQWTLEKELSTTFNWHTRARLGWLDPDTFQIRSENWFLYEALRSPLWGFNVSPKVDLSYAIGSETSRSQFRIGVEIMFFW